jgi:hypothetical protein
MYFEDLKNKVKIEDEDKTVQYKDEERLIRLEQKALQTINQLGDQIF